MTGPWAEDEKDTDLEKVDGVLLRLALGEWYSLIQEHFG